MAIDTNPTLGTLGASSLETTEKSWPKCARCTERLGRPYPVEYMEIVPEYTQPAHLNGGFQITLVVRCHGEGAQYQKNIPAAAVGPMLGGDEKRRALSAIAAQDLGTTYVFGKSGTGRTAKPTGGIFGQ